MNKKILVAVTGSTPQILTETIYALHKERNWIPDEVHVLTTTHGQEQIIKTLFEQNIFSDLCQEYDLPKIRFDQDSIHVIENIQGEKISDIKTVDENDLAANMIVHFIHNLCQNPNNEIHVSLAGGRKSMGFYIGYALSLFGRTQDSMSHVLVSHPYEFAREFFFPTKRSQEMKASWWENDKKEELMVDAKDAQIWLSDIPFVRMGVGYSPLKLTNDLSYQQAVALTQTAVSDFKITLNISESTLDCSGFAKIKLSPKELSIYLLFIGLAKYNQVFSIDHAIVNSCDWEEFSDEYLRLQKKYGRDNDGCTEFNKKQIQTAVRDVATSLKNKLKESNLGPYIDNFGILSIKTENYYQLAIKPENITIIE